MPVSLRQRLQSIRHRLVERDALRGEQAILALLQAKSAFDGRPLGDLPDARSLFEANARRLAQLEAGRVRGLCAVYDAYARAYGRSPPQLRLALQHMVGEAFPPPDGLPAGQPWARMLEAAAAPFALGPRAAGSIDAVAAVVHLFHPELAGEIRAYLEIIPIRTDVFVTTDAEDKRAAIAQAFQGWARGTFEVRLAPNRGRDIAPKLVACRDVHGRYPLVLHLHGKTSAHDPYLRLWRYFLFETLLGSPDIVTGVLRAFAAEPRLGVVAAQHFHPVRPSLGWGGNQAIAQGLARRMGFELDPETPPDFPSGSMFWARSAALAPLLALDLKETDFPEEAGQTDETLAHAVERLYLCVCAAAGFKWIKTSRRELAHPSDPTPRSIRVADDLTRALNP